ncbi:DUF4037 domain-containing protein [Bifidobacterium pullorum subsp. gallinarum]|uniref:DUF4037 domain-containing protein n=1 Tax=Bifidobacterium pullorum subsp. gallinarum TaxID=78344 RepID=A0A4P6E5H5_9BIFI|nr:DUF4037 domain-containing protein [Bifidobacterium pullorum]QAY33469.1 DUF4037 domain-containing protein [Bifidobacterium pullorum subsp. gallinarum]
MDNDTLQAALAAWAAGEHNDAGISATSELLESGESSDYNDAQATDSHESADSDNLIPRSAAATFDAEAFLKGLDAIFEAHEGATKAEPYLLQAMDDAENAGDDAGLLTVLNETMGFYRSQGRHEDNQWIVQRSIELALRMRLEGTEAWTTTLINAATSMRAAGRYDQAEDLYHQAIDSAKATLSPTDRRMAALHNNLSMLYSETGRPEQALHELEAALRVLEAASVDPSNDIDIATTHTNIALILLELPSDERHTGPSGETEHAGAPSNRMTTPATSPGSPTDHSTPAAARLDEAMRHARQSLDIYRTAGQEHAGHYASALAGYAQVCLAAGHADEAVRRYRQALSVIEENYGRDNDYYRITAANLVQAQEKAAESGLSGVIATPDIATPGTAMPDAAVPSGTVPSGNTPAHTIPGLKLARAYWNEYGKPLIAERYPEYQGRIAAGLVGHGSECYGFDDELSHDHDFGPGFCLWLTDEDYAAIGERLQADYESLPDTFMGFGPKSQTARAQGAGRRVGVFRVGAFFESITGYRQAPPADRPHEWLMLDEPTLAVATNGEVFADPLGAFSKTRQGFKLMPEDVRLSLISRRLGMIAQAGQYNLPRMLQRGDGAAAWCAINEFAEAVASLVFLINTPVSAGYMPYYKWRFAALRRLSRRMAARLPDACAQLEDVLRLASAACFGGVGFGEGGKGAAPAAKQVVSIVESICAEIVAELGREGLTDSDETFLEWQRPYVEEHIEHRDACLMSL